AERLQQHGPPIRAAPKKLVVQEKRADGGAQNPRVCRFYAQQRNDINRVGMKCLLVRRLINACGGILDAAAKVLHMAQNVALAILRHRSAEAGANPDKGRGSLGDRIALDRNPADDHEASPPQQNVVAGRGKVLPESRQLKVAVINGDMIDAALHDRRYRGVYLDNLGVSQLVSEIAAA